MTVREIFLLGSPLLYETCTAVSESESEMAGLESVITDLCDTIVDFRRRHGVGRAIAAPQIGVKKMIVYMQLAAPAEPVVFINPVLDQRSKEMIEVWDDCMSFPGLLVKVRRHKSCRVVYRDLDWNEREMAVRDGLSELLQHECDHLDGILAVSLSVDDRSLALKSK